MSWLVEENKRLDEVLESEGYYIPKRNLNAKELIESISLLLENPYLSEESVYVLEGLLDRVGGWIKKGYNFGKQKVQNVYHTGNMVYRASKSADQLQKAQKLLAQDPTHPEGQALLRKSQKNLQKAQTSDQARQQGGVKNPFINLKTNKMQRNIKDVAKTASRTYQANQQQKAAQIAAQNAKQTTAPAQPTQPPAAAPVAPHTPVAAPVSQPVSAPVASHATGPSLVQHVANQAQQHIQGTAPSPVTHQPTETKNNDKDNPKYTNAYWKL